MAEAVLMPKSGISVESCLIGAWRKNVGDAVEVGDILFDYETDKAAFECESTAAGVLLEIFYAPGDEVEVLQPVCVVGKEGEDAAALRPGGSAAPKAESPSAPVADKTAAAQSGAIPAADAETTVAAEPEPAGEIAGEVKASPRAKKLAKKLGVDVRQATPGGPENRVTERDVQELFERSRRDESEIQSAAPTTAPPVQSVAETAESTAKRTDEYTDEPFTKIRSVIAKSMTNSLQNLAQLTHHHSFDATEILTLRAMYKESGDEALSGVSIGDMVFFATVRTLMEYPEVNSLLPDDTTLRRYNRVHLGVAVDTPRGLMVPTVFHADQKSLTEISAEVKTLAASARKGNINPDLLTGATFTVSNLGATGVEMFTPIINPPQVAILGVCGRTTKVKETKNGLTAYPSIGLSLTYDHRALDGAPASRFAQAVIEKLERFRLLLSK
ncbi:MAG: 2-oxo acid dehydrogenase subunit E2 [Clostridiales Family XIII bacterium]|jgi:pyruvate dehydrogenase E2 component (dihydrolipoamide acetyltransferase)|nr:2-oxo acid dehydrogenase subunit E2 [Clostridiales Family XIII bacterium]